MNEPFRPISLPTRTVDIMKRYDIKMKKSLGQNFLVEPQILEKMIDTAQIDDQTTVIEVGPGIGALTEFLARSAKQVLSFEIDQRFIAILEETLAPYDNVKVVHEDILKVDFNEENYRWLANEERLVVVANLPYYITTPIIMHLLESRLPFDTLVMMMQKEVAERMTANIGTKAYSSLSIAVQNVMDSELSFIVPKTVFIPQPNVDSAVLKLTRRPAPLVEVDNPARFEHFVRTAFTQRRKTLWNNLRHYLKDVSADQIQQALDEAKIDGQRRGESLSIDEFASIYQALYK
ncbi:16S rRNA (adenine(1518)-N(6)/adenine(1519)-N(6))-dimethyltransferase RsmA [Dolosicoccus paucivorans]|uniref:Ribosomal RNA small subunit methyltransferase A n=1 Tax=Dolosicoccus paucivorans TaxID=84521 RepID=A0A1G8NL65_9LACT|nr:16S rRNA (adenine(1518)-N(6)/adenine(1519)-N(6))-dimethyltransferase RsmA [Dolosicoccus paucivorans]PMB83688.1 16S rRNA (adenine(1518)-N(6)/adenine(1519)-N(6))-dimethyltransferase RsmA [Dolosicoccus paucivorans]PMC57875.1 16S rRNA (adenine(1518)-N(6)/adenine(1519)-N(6))-dimethyltransferase RsmA [Dolosicoccus paucivorans]SDI80918.1 16S rRNA (adenine1518-N6/adenine1519-N6)-dimethyltransferase [Dolosicoccus paucivorans]